MAKVLQEIKGTHSFTTEIPYRLVETGKKGTKPLIVYLHGFGQNMIYLEKKMEPMLNLEAYHLYIQGPYPLYDRSRKKEFSRWGRAWYLFDGNQDQFVRSMEQSSDFIQSLIQQLRTTISFNRCCVMGYSMGAYLAGYFAMAKSEMLQDLIMINGRIKTEVFDDLKSLEGKNILALHGSRDTSVYPEPQHKEIQKLIEYGINAQFEKLPAEHFLHKDFILYSRNWLEDLGYKILS